MSHFNDSESQEAINFANTILTNFPLAESSSPSKRQEKNN